MKIKCINSAFSVYPSNNLSIRDVNNEEVNLWMFENGSLSFSFNIKGTTEEIKIIKKFCEDLEEAKRTKIAKKLKKSRKNKI